MLGAIADDFTGATDLATMLRRSGHRVWVVIEDADVPRAPLASADAIVIALKTRTAPRETAVTDSLAALDRLRAWGATRFYVKYCSTFDSTDEGNIGPVLDAIADALGAARVVVVPSLPSNGRTVYRGHLFVEGDLLENSAMRHHPLTPMTRSRVADLLRPQTAYRVAEVALADVRSGPERLRNALDTSNGRYVVIDAIDESDLEAIGAATAEDVLVSGGSGLALGIPGPSAPRDAWRAPGPARGVVLCGSVSRATLEQVAVAARSQPVYTIDANEAVTDAGAVTAEILAWLEAQPTEAHPVVCAARDRSDVETARRGVPVAPVMEGILAAVARELVRAGRVDALVVAGGETSGAVVRALEVDLLRIGPELAPGVCWSTATTFGRDIAVALKSGNFGRPDLFTQAWELLA